MSVILKSGASSDLATVNSSGELTVSPTKVIENAGYVAMVSMNDSGSLTGTPSTLSPETTFDYRLRVGLDTLVFGEVFNATAQNTSNWRHIFATMTATQAGGSILFNANSTLTTNTGVQHTTWRTFQIFPTCPIYAEWICNSTNVPLTNQVVEFGLFPHGTGTAAPTEGVFVRHTSAGIMGILNFNGNETSTGAFAQTFSPNVVSKMVIVVDRTTIQFWMDDILLGSLNVPDANGQPYLTTSLPLSMQFRNSGTVTGSPVMQFKVSSVNVTYGDISFNKPWSHILAGNGNHAYQGQNGGTMGTTATYANSLAPGAGVVLTNTTNAGTVTFGGQSPIQPTLAVSNDGIVCSYQNPAGSVNQTPRVLYITGVRIQGAVTTVLAGGPVVYAYSLAFGHTAVSLATAELGSFASGTTKAARRIALGYESYAATAAVGTIGQTVYMPFNSPITVNPGEFIAIAAKNVGVVTSSGVITVLVTFDGYYE